VVRFLLSILVVVIILYTVYANMKAFYTSAEEQSRYSPIEIDEDEIAALADEYFKSKSKGYALPSFLGSLRESSKLGLTVPLSYETTMLAKKHFYTRAGPKLGLELGPETIAQLCFDLPLLQPEPEWTL
jgi:hypothetical protein